MNLQQGFVKLGNWRAEFMRSGPAVWLLGVCILFIVPTSMLLLYNLEAKEVEQETFLDLEEDSLFSLQTVKQWIDTNEANLNAMVQDEMLLQDLAKLVQGDETAQDILKDHIKQLAEANRFEAVSFVSSNQKKIVETSSEPHKWQIFDPAKVLFQSQYPYYQFFKDEQQQTHLEMIAPLVSLKPTILKKDALGFVAVHINPEQFLDQLAAMHTHQTQGSNGAVMFAESKAYVLVNPFGDALGELSSPHAASDWVSLISAEVRKRQQRGEQHGPLVIDNGLGQTLFVYYRFVPNLDLFVFSHTEKASVLAELHSNQVWIFILLLSLVLLIVGFTFHWGRVQRKLENAQHLQEKQRFLQANSEYFMGLLKSSPMPYQSLSEQGIIQDVNDAWCELFGYSREEVLGKPFRQFITDASESILQEHFPKLIATGRRDDVHFDIVRKDGSVRHVILQGRVYKHPNSQMVRTHCSLVDMTELLAYQAQQAKQLKRTEGLFELLLGATEQAEQGLLEAALNKVEEITNSKIGFAHFVDVVQSNVALTAWSQNTLDQECAIPDLAHYSLEEAGMWADAVRTQQPVVVNDYALYKKAQGLPKGHVQLTRFMCVPVLANGEVRFIVGVGNADEPYNEEDVKTLSLFANELYQVLMVKRTQDQLLERERRFHLLFDNAPVPYLLLNAQGEIEVANQALFHLMGFAENANAKQVLGQKLAQFLSEDSQKELSDNWTSLLSAGLSHPLVLSLINQQSQVVLVHLTAYAVTDKQTAKVALHCVLVDVTEQNLVNQKLELAAKVFSSSGEGILVTDKDLKIVSVNEAFSDILGYSQADVLGKSPDVFKSGRHDKAFYKHMWHELKQTGKWQGEIWNRAKQGHLVPELLTVTVIENERGEVQNYVGVFSDISKLKNTEAELDYLAHHDMLTGLPNRRRLLASLEFSLSHGRRENKTVALLMIDLDRFKGVNDGYGHKYGDEVLKQVAQILRSETREVDMVARLGGDEFCVLMVNLVHIEDAARLAQKITRLVAEPILLSNQKSVSIGASVGISLNVDKNATSEELIQHADTALYLAKNKGRGTYEYYTDELTAEVQASITLESQLRRAIELEQLRLVFQPQVDLGTGEVVGAEALVRWQHPELGMVSPADFISIAEESDLIADIGRWVLFEACRHGRAWADRGLSQFRIAVNVSPKQLVYSDVYLLVQEAIKLTHFPASMLELEITESGLLWAKDQAISLMARLRSMGISIAIDDFGTGYSSLAYLKALPLDVLKIDKQFIDDIPNHPRGMQIVNSIIAMGKNLQLKLLAEGVEEEVQRDYLKFEGCDVYQGYLKSPPVTPEVFEAQYIDALLTAQNAQPNEHKGEVSDNG